MNIATKEKINAKFMGKEYISQKVTIIQDDGNELVISGRLIKIEIEENKEIIIPLKPNILYPNSLTLLCGQYDQSRSDSFIIKSRSANSIHILLESIADEELSKIVKDNEEYLSNYP